MDQVQRIQFFRAGLEKALRDSAEVVIFENPESGKFVQFAVQSGDEVLWVDIPFQQLNEEQHRWLQPYMEPANDANGQPMSLQKEIPSSQAQYAAEYTEWVFTQIFRLPASFSVTVDIFS